VVSSPTTVMRFNLSYSTCTRTRKLKNLMCSDIGLGVVSYHIKEPSAELFEISIFTGHSNGRLDTSDNGFEVKYSFVLA